MRIRNRPQVPSCCLDLSSSVSVHTGAAGGGGAKERTIAAKVGEKLHHNGDLLPVLESHGCTSEQSYLGDPPPSDLHLQRLSMGSGRCDGPYPSHGRTVKVQQQRRKQEGVVDEHKSWNNTYGVHSGNSSGAVSRCCNEYPSLRKVQKAKTGSKPWAMETSLSSSTSDGDCVVKEEEEELGGVQVGNGNGKMRKRRSPAVLMQGSRCSRVNGRGWRCCQQTLVGYSLCEHHLGKGRLRSMNTVRTKDSNKNGGKKDDGIGCAIKTLILSHEQKQEVSEIENEEGEEEKLARRKRKKIGVMKAKSISSLLDETQESASAIITEETSRGC